MTEQKSLSIAVVGDRERALPFLAAGAKVVITDDIDEARGAVSSFAENGYPVILVSDALIRGMPDLLDRYASSPVPCITVIPGEETEAGFSTARLNSVVEQAIGITISGMV